MNESLLIVGVILVVVGAFVSRLLLYVGLALLLVWLISFLAR